ncbi:MAG TPA: thiamine phosphate synthase [Kofleriaceae bacterium]|jgi:thiamine-phosphate diphosphorylase
MASVRDAIRGFYAVLDRDDEQLARILLAAGARVLQVRLKPAGRRVGADEVLRVAKMARRVCDDVGAALVVNDRLDVALLAGADGVHLGQTDLSVADARPIANKLWIGVSTHNVEQVRAAVAAGADYLGYGPVFATTTKQNPDPTQGLDALRAAVLAAGETPVVAIGGVTPAHAVDVYRTGVASICAIGAVNAAADIVGAGRALARA